ncbi:MAG: hypothetical protein ACO3HJ_06595 [Methylophilaceae bacterium]
MIKNLFLNLFKIVLLFGVLMMCIQCSSQMFAQTTVTDVIIAIEKVESNVNPYAINKKEK